jgi:hypothetical protein
MARDIDRGHLRLRHGLPFRVGPPIQLAAHRSPPAVRVAPIRLTITARLTNGRPRQFVLM